VTRGPFVLVGQRQQIAKLQSGEVRLGEEVEVLAIDNPRGFLAGKLIDTIEEMAVASDKEYALRLADSYIAQMGCTAEELPRLVHLYRDVIIDDLRGQIEKSIEEHTSGNPVIRSGFIKFRAATKAVLETDGIRHFREAVPREDVRRYAFEGCGKIIYSLVSFDSTPEKDLAVALEDDVSVLKWVRPPDGNFPIAVRGVSYNPDFIVETADRKYIIEVKMRKELMPVMDAEVRAKALAALKWCEVASAVPGSKPWEYRIIPDDVIRPVGMSLKFILSHAVTVA
jgi:type III restriction enzyme